MLKDLPFGIEIEMTGITREQAAKALGNLWNTTPRYGGGTYSAWEVSDTEGKTWTLMSDGSIHTDRWHDGDYDSYGDDSYSVEMVSPKLDYDELPKLQEAVRTVRKAHAKVNDSCGIHVHVDASRLKTPCPLCIPRRI